MGAHENKKTIQYAIEHQFDLPEYAALLADDFEAVTIADPATFPRGLTPRSRAEHLAGVERAAEVFIDEQGNGGMTLTIQGMIAENDTVATEVYTTARLRSDPARRVVNRSHGVWEFDANGKIRRHRAYEDTAYLQAFWADAAEYIVPTRPPAG